MRSILNLLITLRTQTADVNSVVLQLSSVASVVKHAPFAVK